MQVAFFTLGLLLAVDLFAGIEAAAHGQASCQLVDTTSNIDLSSVKPIPSRNNRALVRFAGYLEFNTTDSDDKVTRKYLELKPQRLDHSQFNEKRSILSLETDCGEISFETKKDLSASAYILDRITIKPRTSAGSIEGCHVNVYDISCSFDKYSKCSLSKSYACAHPVGGTKPVELIGLKLDLLDWEVDGNSTEIAQGIFNKQAEECLDDDQEKFRMIMTDADAVQYPDDAYLADLLADDSELPAEVDWRKEGRVSSVKKQGKCGVCWAIATAGLLEGQQKVVLKNVSQPIDLSVQQLMDCMGSGCRGGDLVVSVNFTVNKEGLMADSDYPYTAATSKTGCHYDESKVVIRPKNFTILPRNDERALQKVVAKYGPVAVTVDAIWDTFVNYKGGVYSDERCGFGICHCVLVVGYGTDPKQGDYWIIKNSWGTDWGEDGYMRMEMHKNRCLIAFQPVVATF